METMEINMNEKKEELSKLYIRKIALRELLKALEDEQEKKIRDILEEMFEELRDNLKSTDFLISLHAHYDEMIITIFKNHNSDDEQKIKVLDFKIDSVTGERDEELERVIEIVKFYLMRFN